MGYLSIKNLYAATEFLTLAGPKVYASEKVHGTSCSIKWSGTEVRLTSGCISQVTFANLFDLTKLKEFFKTNFGDTQVCIFGEGYGGKVLKQSELYGKETKFVAFDVMVGETWLVLPEAASLCEKLGLEFVYWTEVDNTVEALDAERNKPSVQAARNGMGEGKTKEGIVIKPLTEKLNTFGERLIAKHKNSQFAEVSSHREVDPNQVKIFEGASIIANEYCTKERLVHVSSKLSENGKELTIADTGSVIKAMLFDIKTESTGEIKEWTPEVEQAIKKLTSKLFKESLQTIS